MRSLRRGLLQWTLGALAFGSILLVLVSYVFVLDEMNEVLDDNLREVATSVARFHTSGQLLAVTPSRPRGEPAPDQGDLVTRVWRRDGRAVDGPDSAYAFPFSAEPGARRLMLDGVEWRGFTVVDERFVVLAAQRTAARQQMAVEAASKLLVPLLVLASLIAALLVVALRRGLAPLGEATTQIAQRNALTLEPIDGAEMPGELRPLVGAFNGLMKRVADAFATQQQFIADAAHELRSPVTAVRLQIDLIEHAHDASEREATLRDAREGMDRLQRLVEQLLQLSRAGPDAIEARGAQREPVDLDRLVLDTVSAFARTASLRQVDLGAEAHAKTRVAADPHELQVVLNNLVRNALHYVPPGSRVDVAASVAEDGTPMLCVSDDGPGIAAPERERVFDRFYRGAGEHVREGDPSGSGLGLAIVKALAGRNGASVSLHDGHGAGGGVGLAVHVRFDGGGAQPARPARASHQTPPAGGGASAGR
ncbi:two-component system, OmpR family, sensor kinase [Variovorax sp. OK605]|uniref:ATP-binding protein n=1 Tax=Variovorax sp. OK605 TaxID=1855317 RepID=UPI0008EB5E91|nr:ATP-binding protein [Variovorax sp. OK605]SFP90190.1 two-component system, OmpR family, sensor kinase [Variovorax sp. OK605]